MHFAPSSLLYTNDIQNIGACPSFCHIKNILVHPKWVIFIVIIIFAFEQGLGPFLTAHFINHFLLINERWNVMLTMSNRNPPFEITNAILDKIAETHAWRSFLIGTHVFLAPNRSEPLKSQIYCFSRKKFFGNSSWHHSISGSNID